MRITLLSSDDRHPVYAYLEKWVAQGCENHMIELVQDISEASGGDILFLISCSEIIAAQDRARYSTCLVLHASDLPKGRGWSPHIWELAQGAESVTLTLLEAEDEVDSGHIWMKSHISVPKHALWDEINDLIFHEELELIDFAIKNHNRITPKSQSRDLQATYYPRRTPENSLIDPDKSLAEQFDKIRICDPNRFPAYFEYLGQCYILKLEKYCEK